MYALEFEWILALRDGLHPAGRHRGRRTRCLRGGQPQRPGRDRKLLRRSLHDGIAAKLEAHVSHPEFERYVEPLRRGDISRWLCRRRRCEIHGIRAATVLRSIGRANITFSDEAGQHLPVTYANEYSGQIRLATLNGSQWSVQTVFRQSDPLHNQLFYPVAAEFNGQTTFAGLQVANQTDGNQNVTRFLACGCRTPAGPSTPPVATSPPPPPTTPTPANSTPVYVPAGPVTNVAMVVGSDAEPGVSTTVTAYRSDGSLQLTISPFGSNYSGGAARGPRRRDRRRHIMPRFSVFPRWGARHMAA